MTRIVVFDSGVGGIAIGQAIHNLIPLVEILHVIDNQWFPYGEKPAAELQERILYVLDNVVQTLQPDILVIACNTASTLVLEPLRARHSLPIVGVVPAVKPAAEMSKSKVLGVIATPATIAREYTQELINQFAGHCELVMHGSTELVYLAEDWAYEGKFNSARLGEILSPFVEAYKYHNLDTLVLACTHFPLLKHQIEQCLPGISVVDSSDAIARQVERVLETIPKDTPTHTRHSLWHTGPIERDIHTDSLMSNYELSALALK